MTAQSELFLVAVASLACAGQGSLCMLPCDLPSNWSATTLVSVVQLLLKCADIGHLAADVATHKRWAYQLEEEFFRQVCIALLMCIFLCPMHIVFQRCQHNGRVRNHPGRVARGGMQGDKEKASGLTVSPLMDREHAGGMTRSQVRGCALLGMG